MDSASQIENLVDNVENDPNYEITEKEAKGFISEIRRIAKEDKTNMPPIIAVIMAYINILFPEMQYDYEADKKTAEISEA